MTKLFVVRHGQAGDQEAWRLQTKKPDGERPLTKIGKAETKMLAKALKFFFKRNEAIVTSPLVRAEQTAKIIFKRASPKATFLEIAELKPTAKCEATLKKVQELAGEYKQIVVVGHEPHLGKFLSLVLTGGVSQPFAMAKGAVALIEFAEKNLTAGQGQLRCMLQPSHLKKIRKK